MEEKAACPCIILKLGSCSEGVSQEMGFVNPRIAIMVFLHFLRHSLFIETFRIYTVFVTVKTQNMQNVSRFWTVALIILSDRFLKKGTTESKT